jgi:hypothetical protein
MIDINEKGPLKKIAERYLNRQIEQEKKRLLAAKIKTDTNITLHLLREIKNYLTVIAKQNEASLEYLEKLTNGPAGDVHYIKLIEYDKDFGEIFIDFVRGDRDGRSKLPPNSLVTYPYSHVYMIKITNDGPANISFQTNRHARMIDLHAGESDTVSENENFQLTELRISNNNKTDLNANVRIVIYA